MCQDENHVETLEDIICSGLLDSIPKVRGHYTRYNFIAFKFI